jgi:hypothetical protein
MIKKFENFKKFPKTYWNEDEDDMYKHIKFYYSIHMEKSIIKFNIALEKLKIKEKFYNYLGENDIPNADIVYLIFDDKGFSVEEFVDFDSQNYYKDMGDIYVEDWEVSAIKYNL